MPKIPVYQQQVGLAVGSLGPRASSAAFEAPGRATAALAQQAGQVAFQFGVAEKKTQAEEAKNAAVSEYMPKAQTLIENPQSNTVTDFEKEAGDFKKDALASVDARTDLTESQKRFVKNNLGQSIDSKMSIGRSRVFTQQQANRKAQAEAALGVYIDEAVTNPGMRQLTMKNINDILDNGVADGLNLDFTRESIDLEINKREILAETADQSKGIGYFRAEKDKILNGKGRGTGKTAAERQALSRMYETHINYLEGPLTAEAKAKAENAIASMTLTGEGAKQAAESASMFRQAGREDLALDIEMQSTVAMSTFDTVDALTFSSTEDVLDTRDRLMSEARAASGTDQAAQKLMEVEMFDKAIQRRQKDLDADPVSYIQENFKRKFPTAGDPTKGATVDQVLVAQETMGIPEGERKIFTNGQVKEFNKRVSQAQTAEDVDAVLIEFGVKSETGVPVSNRIAAAGMRQLRANGLSLAMNYVANLPEAPMSDVLLQSALPGAIQIGVTPTNKDLLNSQIRNNEAIRTHLNSMLGGSFIDFQGNTIRAAAADTTGMRDARQQHIDMISNLTVYLIQQDGQSLSGDERIDANSIQTYIDQAATIFDERYSYVENFPNENVSLRLPKSMAGSANFIQQNLKLAVDELNEGNVYFRPQRDGEVKAEYDTQRKVYLTEVKDGYGWVISSDGNNAILLDKNAGAVMDVDGQPIKRSLADLLKRQETQQTAIQTGRKKPKVAPEPISAFDVETVSQ